jgi:anti-sigma regulatory factor (Ser/Thr protein kinase)
VSTGIDLRLSGGARAASAARHALDPLVHDLEPDLHENLRLLVSELVTNSIRHSGVRRRGSIELRVTVTDRWVRVEVCDPGPGFDARVSIPTVGQTDGWGLFLVEQIADRWGVQANDLTCVWFELKRPRRPQGRA